MKPLNGVRVVSIEQFGAAPYGSMFLADLGAEVIKVENLAIGGDPARKTGPYLLGDSDSQYFQTWNMNKKSVTLDLRTPAGKAALEELILGAEVVLNNMRGDLPAKMGLDYKDALEAEALARLRASVGLRARQRARLVAGVRLFDAGRGGPDVAHRRARRPAHAHRRALGGRPRDRPHRHGGAARGTRAGARHGPGAATSTPASSTRRCTSSDTPRSGISTRATCPSARRAAPTSRWRRCRRSRAPTAGSS
jgi:hypothetical protein